MTIKLPKPIADYFAADKINGEVAQCFTSTAVVTDEGNTYSGSDEIRKWKSEATSKYQYTSEPVEFKEIDGKIVVTSFLVGNFPGSPIHLQYHFTLEDQKISLLKIG
jgi:hypothetical protein